MLEYFFMNTFDINELILNRLVGLIITDEDGVFLYQNKHLPLSMEKWQSSLADQLPGIRCEREIEWEFADREEDAYYDVHSFLFDNAKKEYIITCPEPLPERFIIHVLYDVSIYAELFKEMADYGAEMDRLRHKIVYESEHDSLTELYNRGKFMELKKAAFTGFDSIAVYYLDLNYLKRTNDAFGHEEGNRLLIKAADSIRAVLGDDIYGFRIGGDEFLIVAANLSRKAADALKADWQEELARINSIETKQECIVACGMAYAKKPYDLTAVLNKADRRMYMDKRAIKIQRGDDPDVR